VYLGQHSFTSVRSDFASSAIFYHNIAVLKSLPLGLRHRGESMFQHYVVQPKIDPNRGNLRKTLFLIREWMIVSHPTAGRVEWILIAPRKLSPLSSVKAPKAATESPDATKTMWRVCRRRQCQSCAWPRPSLAWCITASPWRFETDKIWSSPGDVPIQKPMGPAGRAGWKPVPRMHYCMMSRDRIAYSTTGYKMWAVRYCFVVETARRKCEPISCEHLSTTRFEYVFPLPRPSPPTCLCCLRPCGTTPLASVHGRWIFQPAVPLVNDTLSRPYSFATEFGHHIGSREGFSPSLLDLSAEMWTAQLIGRFHSTVASDRRGRRPRTFQNLQEMRLPQIRTGPADPTRWERLPPADC